MKFQHLPKAYYQLLACCHYLFLIIGLLLPLRVASQPIAYEEVLAFAKPWVQPQDYAWKRESTSRIEGDKEPGLRIKDMGRLRVEFVKFSEESAILNIKILQYQFETQLKGEQPFSGVSPLQGQMLPPIFLHWALGYSMGIEPGTDLPKPAVGQQASQVFDLIDFRGFIPKSNPHPGEDWPLRLVPDRGKTFLFKEELERSFHCDSSKAEKNKTMCGIQFSETFKMTPTKESGNWELTERKGTYWISLPKGMIDAAEWKTHSTESTKTHAGATKVETETTVSLSRVEVPFNYTPKPKTAKPKASAGAGVKEIPLPPR